MLNYLRDSLDEMMEKSNYTFKEIVYYKTMLRKIIEDNGGNIQQ